jgi:hypothetical protein
MLVEPSIKTAGTARPVSGAALAEIGLAIAPQRTLTATVVLVEALCP